MPGSAPRRSPARTLVRTVLAALLAAVLGLTSLQPATAAEAVATDATDDSAPASVSGVVTDAQGIPLAGMLVYLMGAFGTSYAYTASDNTAADGSYRIQDVAPGSYSIRFFGDSAHVGEWWDDRMGQADAVTFEVAAGEQLTGMDATLSGGASISGVVTDSDGAALPDATVRIYGPRESGYWDWLTSTTTDANGAYRFGVLRAGAHTIHVLPPVGAGLVDEWWGESPFKRNATRFEVARDEVLSGMDVELPRAAGITGVVTGTDGAPLRDVGVRAWTTNAPVGDDVTHYARTDERGVYVIDGLKAARYDLKFTPHLQTDFLWTGSDEFDVAAGAVVQQDAILVAGASVAGRVTGRDGLPLASAQIRIEPGLGPIDSLSTAADGSYRFSQLPAGSYTLHFDNYPDGQMRFDGSDYFPEWWDDASEREQRTFFDVATGQHLTGMDAELTPESNITGQIISAEGDGIDGGAWLYEVREGEPHYVKSAYVHSDGRYGFDDVRAGTYTIRFTATEHLTEWWGGGSSAADAETFVLGVGEVLTGRDIQLSRGASISGTVTGPDGAPFEAYVTVYAHDGTSWQPVTSRWSDANGEYVFRGLPAGSYTVRFAVDDAYVTQWWNDRPSAETADSIVLVSHGSATGIDAAMEYSPTRLSVPTISGSAWIGWPLSASAGSPTSGATLSYEWLADGEPITGATGKSIILDAAQEGQRITVRVTASAPDRPSTTRVSAATDPVIARPVTGTLPTIAGTATIGSTLTALPGRWTSGTAFSYRWFADGITIPNANGATLVLVGAQAGTAITVQVTGSRDGYSPVSMTSAPTAEVLPGSTSAIDATQGTDPRPIRQLVGP